MRLLSFILLLIFFWGCSHFQRQKTLPPTKGQTTSYILKDKTGVFSLDRKSSLNQEKKLVIVKQTISNSEEGAEGDVLEEVATYSTPGMLKEISILRPNRSLFSVWFDKKKYSTEMKLNLKTHKLDVKINSPDENRNGTKQFALPKKTTGVFCFFSQIVECVKATNFFHTAIDKDAGQMNFHVIWENYPFIQDQYSDLPNDVFSSATFEYEGKNERGEYKFTLQLPNQAIFYFVDQNADLLKMFWVSQGLSVVRRDKEADLDEGESETQ